MPCTSCGGGGRDGKASLGGLQGKKCCHNTLRHNTGFRGKRMIKDTNERDIKTRSPCNAFRTPREYHSFRPCPFDPIQNAFVHRKRYIQVQCVRSLKLPTCCLIKILFYQLLQIAALTFSDYMSVYSIDVISDMLCGHRLGVLPTRP